MVDHHREPERLLQHLLGPLGPDIGCERCFELLDVYLEAELAGQDAHSRLPGMRVHLEGCPACGEEYDSLRELLTALK